MRIIQGKKTMNESKTAIKIGFWLTRMRIWPVFTALKLPID